LAERVTVEGLTVTAIGVSVTVAVAVFVVSVLLVAVMVALAAATGVGAVYTPAEVMLPTEAVQVTPGVVVPSLVTAAVKVCVCPAARVAVPGVTLTETTAGEAELLLLLHPVVRNAPMKQVERARKSLADSEKA
jgi:hypothetical protein